jgi:CheY-like chemotaxis protein
VARTILVADDSPTIQKKASGILTGEGLDVVTVSNGVAAVKKLPAINPLVVLADVSMPGKDGYEVCEFVKGSAELRHVPVILIFSDVDAYEEARGARVQADGRIRKPFDHAELIAIVSKFIAQAEAAAPKPAPPPPAPTPEYVVAPVDEEPEIATKPEEPDLSALSEGVAFGVPATEDTVAAPSEPAADSYLAPEQPAYTPEAAPAEPAEVPAYEAPQEEAVVSEDSLLLPEEPEPSEPAPAERTMMFRAPADIAQPVFTDEVAESTEYVAEPPAPVEPEIEQPAAASRTLESYTLDDAATGHVRFESAQAEAPPEFEPSPEIEPSPEVAAPAESPLEAEAPAPVEEAPPPVEEAAPPAEPEIERFEAPAPEPEPEAAPAPEFFAPSPEPEPPASEEAAAPLELTPPPEAASLAPAPSAAISAEQVYAIVHKVVAKMSPPAFPPQMIEDMARRFADEIAAELNSQS